MKIWNILFVGAVAAATASSYADNTLKVKGLNFNHADYAWIYANGVGGHESYLDSYNGVLTIGKTNYTLKMMYCADMKTPEGSLPVTYKVNLVPVNDEEAWLIANLSTQSGFNASKDSGLQLAIWKLENPGFGISNPNDSSVTTYMNQDLALGAGHTANGTLLQYLSGGHGREQTLIIAPPVPEPAPFIGLGLGLVGLAAFRRRRVVA